MKDLSYGAQKTRNALTLPPVNALEKVNCFELNVKKHPRIAPDLRKYVGSDYGNHNNLVLTYTYGSSAQTTSLRMQAVAPYTRGEVPCKLSAVR